MYDVPSGWECIHLNDPNDPRVFDFVRLTDMQWRSHAEVEGGYFIAEGAFVIDRVAALQLDIRSVLTTRKWLPRLAETLATWQGSVYVVDDATMEGIAGYRVHRGALAAVARPAPTSLGHLLDGSGHLVVLEDLVDHTNVGLAFRSALALGVSGMVLSPRCADPLYRRAIKASMGAVLSMPWARADEWPGAITMMTDHGMSAIALTPADDAVDIAAGLVQREHERVALLIGGEGYGLSREALALSELRACIPMDSQVDSLNAAAATAVACYALRMSRRRNMS